MAFTMTSKKPYLLPHNKVTEPAYERWKGVLLDNIMKNKKFQPLINITWSKSSVSNRGLTGDTAAETSKEIDALLQHISHYGPAAVQRDIMRRCTSLTEVWKIIRTWAGLKSSGFTLQAYYIANRVGILKQFLISISIINYSTLWKTACY